MTKEPRQYSRQERKDQIIKQFNLWHEKGDTEPKTMYRIAKALDLVPSQHVADILMEMSLEGMLTFEERDKKGRWTGRYYSVVKTLITEKSLRRQITLRKRGVAVGQLEMFS